MCEKLKKKHNELWSDHSENKQENSFNLTKHTPISTVQVWKG